MIFCAFLKTESATAHSGLAFSAAGKSSRNFRAGNFFDSIISTRALPVPSKKSSCSCAVLGREILARLPPVHTAAMPAFTAPISASMPALTLSISHRIALSTLRAQLVDDVADRRADAAEPDLVGEEADHDRHAAVHDRLELRADLLDRAGGDVEHVVERLVDHVEDRAASSAWRSASPCRCGGRCRAPPIGRPTPRPRPP